MVSQPTSSDDVAVARYVLRGSDLVVQAPCPCGGWFDREQFCCEDARARLSADSRAVEDQETQP